MALQQLVGVSAQIRLNDVMLRAEGPVGRSRRLALNYRRGGVASAGPLHASVPAA